MSKAKLAAFVAVLVMAVSANASAQSAQAALKAPPHMTRARLAVWCKNHPTATADCKEVRADMLIPLRHGEPIRFGADLEKCVALDNQGEPTREPAEALAARSSPGAGTEVPASQWSSGCWPC